MTSAGLHDLSGSPIDLPDAGEIQAAAERIAPYIRRTPIHTSRQLDAQSSAAIFLKCENFQRTGAFKVRGAMNAVWSLDEERAQRGVAAHSSGNHAAALACAAASRDIPAWVVMPSNAPAVKRWATEGYGAQVIECRPTVESRESMLAEVVAEFGAVEIHPYDNRNVIAGAGTAALELLSDVDDLDLILAPVGGGGLLSGTAIATRSIRPQADVWGAEPAGANDAACSLATGVLVPQTDPQTMADGLLTSLSPRTFAAICADVSHIQTVTEDEIVTAMHFVWERMKLVIEPSCAVPVAVALRGDCSDRRVGIIISGGNVDLGRLPF